MTRIAFLLLLLAALSAGAAPLRLHVAPNGDDAGDGSAERPFATLARARDAVREARARGAVDAVTVVLAGGTYWLSEPLQLGPEDGGTADSPVEWRARAGERVVLRGGRPIVGWQPWEGHPGVYRADLAAQGLAGASFHQLFLDGDGPAVPPQGQPAGVDGFAERLILARHPNDDASQPRHGGYLYTADRARQARQALVYAEGDIPWDAWGDIPQAEVVSTYNLGWQFALAPIASVDRQQRIIQLQQPVRGTFIKLNRYFIQNVLGALDAPGEWYLDRATSTLYLMPPDGQPPADGAVIAPVVDHVIEARGTIPYNHVWLNTSHRGPRQEAPLSSDTPLNPIEHVTFRGFDIEIARQDGIRLVGARHCAVIACRFTNLGNIGVNLGGSTSSFYEVGNPRVTPATGEPLGAGGGGQILLLQDPCMDCRVEGVDAWSVGSEGVMLFGERNLAENCHVWDIGLYAKDAPCINLLGLANVARRNTLHDCPRCTVFLKGEDNVVELNDNHHANLETSDMGALRMVQRNLNLKGNVIRHNRVEDSVGYGFRGNESTHYESPYFTWGIYLDDFTSGTTVEGNLVTRCGRGGIMIHGGGDNDIVNNLCYNAGEFQIEFAPISRDDPVWQHAFADNRVARNILVCTAPRAWAYRWTSWSPDAPVFRNNLIWPGEQRDLVPIVGGWAGETWDNWLTRKLDTGTVVADPLLVDPENGDFRLRPDSPALALGFEPLPFEQMGCYASDTRATWPLTPGRERPRETPILHHVPEFDPALVQLPEPMLAGPVRADFEDVPVGAKPAFGDVLAPPPSAIVVTDETASEGDRSLTFVDAPGLAQDWMPRIYWPLDFRAGTVRLALSLCLDPDAPPSLYIDPRHYGAGDYRSGPMLNVLPSGELKAGEETLAKLPLDQWVRLELTIPLGQPTSRLRITPAGGASQTVDVPHRSAQFTQLQRVVVSSLSTDRSVFWVDDVVIEPVGEE